MEQRPHIFDPVQKIHVTIYSQNGVTIYQNIKQEYLRVNSYEFDKCYANNIKCFGLVKYMAFALPGFNQGKFEHVLDNYIQFTKVKIPKSTDKYQYMISYIQEDWNKFTAWFRLNKKK